MRMPTTTRYQGPLANFDDQVSPEDFLARVVHRRPVPLLKTWGRMDYGFYGKLFDQLANAHVALVRVASCQRSAKNTAHALRKELAGRPFGVSVILDPDLELDWMVLVYNDTIHTMNAPAWHDSFAPTSQWVDMKEAARILCLEQRQTIKLAHKYAEDVWRLDKRRQLLIRRDQLPILANRPRQRGKNRKPIRYDRMK